MLSHKNLDVWNRSVDLVTEIYKFAEKLPGQERFNIVSQIQRAAVSIPVNISEGVARNSTKEYIRFLYISLGSCSELETLMIIITNIYQKDTRDLQDTVRVISRMLLALINSLKRKLNKQITMYGKVISYALIIKLTRGAPIPVP